jgi:hypothetical protein
MTKRILVRMKGLTGKNFSITSVKGVPQQGIAYPLTMNPNLMGSAGYQAEFHQGVYIRILR